MNKIYKKLTEEQKKRGVIFSSCLSVGRTETEKDTIHEVFKVTEDKTKPNYIINRGYSENEEEIKRLRDDKFFNNSHWNFNIIRE